MDKSKKELLNESLIEKLKRQEQEHELKKQLLSAPELFITEKGSDAHLDELARKLKLIEDAGYNLSDIVANVLDEYQSKFTKDWFYRLADLAKVSRSIMDVYVKPNFVRLFIIQFVYARFPYMILRTLRSRNRKTSTDKKRTKLFQHLTKTASEQLDMVIAQVYRVMGESFDLKDFKMRYSKEFKIYFQTELF